MTIGKGQSGLIIQDSTAFLYIHDLNDIFQHKEAIDRNIANNKMIALAMIWNGQTVSPNMNQDQKLELYKWLNTLPVLSIAVVNDDCHGDLLELMMICDIRLGGNNLSIRFPEDESGFIFDFEERCQLLMGKERNIGGYRSLLKSTIQSDEIYNRRFINQMINMDDVLNEVQKYIHKILNHKENDQVQSIIKCFNHYKHLGLNANRELLLEEESKQFCNLMIKKYLKSRA